MGEREQVFPGDEVFISDPNILIPFTSDYREDIDWLKGFHAVQVKIIIYLQHYLLWLSLVSALIQNLNKTSNLIRKMCYISFIGWFKADISFTNVKFPKGL